MDRKLKIGLIGAGGIAAHAHMPGYAKMDNVEIVAICDIKPEKAEALAKEYNVAQVYEDYKDVLDIPGLDAPSLRLKRWREDFMYSVRSRMQ